MKGVSGAMEHRRFYACLLALGLCMLLLLSACDAGRSMTPTIVIKVATDLPLTGGDASEGQLAQNGAQLAVDQANANHVIAGVTLQLVTIDDAQDPQKGVNNVTAMLGDAQVAGMIGPFESSVAQTELPIANNASFAMISPGATGPCLTQNSAASGCNGANDKLSVYRPTHNVTFFRDVTTDDLQGAAEAAFLYTTRHYRSVYVIDDSEAYGTNLAQYFVQAWKKLGGVVIAQKSVKETTSYLPVLAEVASTQPDLLYFAGSYVTGGTQIRQQMLQLSALRKTAFAGAAGIQDKSFARIVGTSGGPIFATVPALDPSTTASAQGFVNAFRQRFGAPGAYSATAYDAMNILIKSIQTALSNTPAPRSANDVAQGRNFRQSVIYALNHTSYDGVLGHTSFDANGDTTNKNMTIYQLLQGPDTAVWKVIATRTVT